MSKTEKAWENILRAVNDIKSKPEKKVKLSDGKNIDDVYEEIIPQMMVKGFSECKKIGYMIFCRPCPYHPNDQHDALYVDPLNSTVRCAKEYSVERENTYLSLDQIVMLRESAEKAKSRDIESARAEVVERHYLSNNIFKTINTEKGYMIFKYFEDLGHYSPQAQDVIKSNLQYAYEKIWGQKPQLYLLTEMKNKVCELTLSGKDLSIFDHDHGDYYYIPFRNVDVLVNRKTGEVKTVEKDPINRPFLSALPYNLSSLDTEEPMPKELEDLLTLVPAIFRETLLMEIVSPLAFTGSRKIFVNFSRVGGTGKTTLLKRLSDELFPGLAIWTEADALDSRFEKSVLVGKSAVLIDEFEGKRSSVKTHLKNLASGNELRIEFKNGPTINIPNKLTVIINTNTLRFENFDTALLQRLIIVPFIKNFKDNEKPEEWSQEAKERALKWLIKYALPLYYKKEPKHYPIDSLKTWIERAKEGEPPIDGIEDFLNFYFIKEHKGLEINGKILTLEEAFNYYLLWTEKVEYIPVSFSEFVDRVKFLALRDNAWLIDSNKLYMKLRNSGLDFFL